MRRRNFFRLAATGAGVIIVPPEGITAAKDLFDVISIRVIKPKPRIIEWR